MTVKDLKKKLEQYPDDFLVVLSRDSEGNGFGELNDVAGNSRFNDGEIGLDHLTPKLKEQGFSEEDVRDGTPCIVLWP